MKIVLEVEDPRPYMEFDKPYRRLDADRCTWCGTVNSNLTVTKERTGNPATPLGRLISRCPGHQAGVGRVAS